MADSIVLKEAVTLSSQANLGEEIVETEFNDGTELPVLQEFETAWLVKDDDGRLFNVRKEIAAEA